MTKPTAGKGEVLLPHTLNHLLSKMLALHAAAVAEAVAPGPHGQAEAERGSAARLPSVPRCLGETPSQRVHSEQRSQPVSEKPLPCACGGVCLPLSSLGGTSVSAFRYMTRSYPRIRVNGGGKEPSGTGTQPPLVWPQCLCFPLLPQFSGPFCYFHKTWLQTQVTTVFLWHGGHAVFKVTTSVIHGWGFLRLQVEWNVGTSH